MINELKSKVMSEFTQKTGDDIDIIISYTDSRRVLYSEKAHRLTNEKYILNVTDENGKAIINIECSCEKGAFYALCDIRRQIKYTGLKKGEHICSPSFAVRG